MEEICTAPASFESQSFQRVQREKRFLFVRVGERQDTAKRAQPFGQISECSPKAMRFLPGRSLSREIHEVTCVPGFHWDTSRPDKKKTTLSSIWIPASAGMTDLNSLEMRHP